MGHNPNFDDANPQNSIWECMQVRAVVGDDHTCYCHHWHTPNSVYLIGVQLVAASDSPRGRRQRATARISSVISGGLIPSLPTGFNLGSALLVIPNSNGWAGVLPGGGCSHHGWGWSQC
jgi:hypothetical protein